MVAPLHVPIMVGGEGVHDEVGAGAAVVYVAEHVEHVDGEALDDVRYGYDEVVGAAGGYDGVYYHAYVGGLVGVVGALVQQFLDDVREVAGQRLAHLGARVLARHVAAYAHQLVYGYVVPVGQVGLARLDELELLPGVVDEGAELFLLGLTQLAAKYFVDLALDVARGVFQHMLKRLVLAVQVGQKVLGALGQVEYGLQVDDFGAGVGYGGERLREQPQVSHVVLNVFGCCFHNICFFNE